MSFDPRVLRVGVEISGSLRWYEHVQIAASISKMANALQNEAIIRLTNMNKISREQLLTGCSPFVNTSNPKRIVVEAGRQSFGASKIFQGEIVSVTTSQPPDIALTFRCKTGERGKTNIVSYAPKDSSTLLSTICREVAQDLDLSLLFQAKDKRISNYNHTGAALRQVDKIGEMGNVNAYVDDEELVVKDFNVPLLGTIYKLSKDSGMIGIPEITEQGVRVIYLFDPKSRLGSRLEIISKLNPAASGCYCVYKMTYDLSNRDTPFYNIAEAKRC